MHKSPLTFGLLMSSLVILAIMPLFNQNNFPNVKAQEYGTYDDYDNDMYSKYPTEVNKYECRTGPFEGFFVSSVEFCKHIKFDKDKDRKDISRDNRTGTQGPQGPPGATGATGATGQPGEDGMDGAQGIQGIQGERGLTGATGPQGEGGLTGATGSEGLPGVTFINGTNVYLVEDTQEGDMSSFQARAICDSGDFVLNGGYSYSGFFDDGTTVLRDQPLTDPIIIPPASPGQGWIASIFGVPPDDLGFNQFTVYAYCFDNPPAHLP